MAEQEKKTNLAKEICNDTAANLQKDFKNWFKSAIYGAATNVIDIVHDNIKRSVAHSVYPNGDAPKDLRRRNDSDYYHDYSAYARSNNAASYASTDRIGTQSATDIKLVTFDTEDDALHASDDMIARIEGSGNCPVGYLYELSPKKLSTSTMDWAFGWTDKDKSAFSVKMITTGIHSGEWMIITPKPHRL